MKYPETAAEADRPSVYQPVTCNQGSISSLSATLTLTNVSSFLPCGMYTSNATIPFLCFAPRLVETFPSLGMLSNMRRNSIVVVLHIKIRTIPRYRVAFVAQVTTAIDL
jgi:hypothetical protein